ncbi:hypothetical protein B0H21DRAFT_698461 [Amylocystis lapponica]|nr:hypothetical protein B0H21DRAFT_698461 [Amylocystis lapponica]
MSTPHALNHDEFVYLAVTVAPSSPFLADPAALAAHTAVTHLGPVGQMRDVQLLSVPRTTWDRVQGDVLSSLNGLNGVLRVDMQGPPRTRARRGGDEL